MANKPFERLREVLRKSKIDDLVGTVLAETPIGKVGRIIKDFSEILGTDDNEESVIEAIEAGVPPEQAVRLREFAARELEAREESFRNEQDNLTERYKAALMSDSRLTKWVRPIVTYVVLAAFIIDWITGRVLDFRGIESAPSEPLTRTLEWVIKFYFGSRAVQHVASQFFAAKIQKS